MDYAEELGHDVKTMQLNFVGINIGHYTETILQRRDNPDKSINKLVLIEDSEWNG